MTISVSPLFEKNETYSLYVLFVDPRGRYVNVRHEGSGYTYRIETPVAPTKGLASLRDKTADFLCTEVTERGPEFALAPKYFAAAPKFVRGGNIGLHEGKTIEFKRSLVYSPSNHKPDADQPFEIAKQIAAFMNTEGGDLYLGVDDDGFVTGIENDYPVLNQATIMMDDKTDEAWTYSATVDGYRRKLMNAVLAYLGESAAGWLDDFEEKTDEGSGLTYLKVHVRPSDDITYLGREQSVVSRADATVSFLSGRERDQYVKQRFFLRGEKSTAEAIAAFKAECADLRKKLADAKSALEDALVKGSAAGMSKVISIYGTQYKLEENACFPLDEKFLKFDKPRGLVYKRGEFGQRLMTCPKKTWQSLYEQLLILCAELDPVKFAALPDNPDFEPKRHCARTKPNFVRKNDRVRLPSSSDYLGKDKDIRANLQGASKAAFLSPTSLPRRLMAHFGIAAEDIRIWHE